MTWAAYKPIPFCVIFITWLSLCVAFTSIRPNTNSQTAIIINTSTTVSKLDQFWKSTGFCPPLPHQESEKWLMSKDMQHNLAYIGAIPNSGIQQVRVHWLLDAVKIYRDKYKMIAYNFTFLDQFVDILWRNNLHPGFEVMGNPGNVFTDLEDESQLYAWRSFVYQLIHRYADKYGLSYLNDWNFESWNEPSMRHFDSLNFTIKGFLNYYDGIADAMGVVSPSLRLGAPGGACKEYNPDTYCWALLNHTVHGYNYFNGDKPLLDYISIHKKGEEPNNTDAMFQKEIEFYADLVKHLPQLANTPIYNDEADPLVSWSAEKWWRADVTYAACVVKIIAQHQQKWVTNRKNESLNFQLLSNDNGFLSYNPHFFTQRTLLARFQINNTATPHVQFIRKPVYIVMGMLSYLGEEQLDIKISGSAKYVGILGSKHVADIYDTQDSNSWSIIIYNSADTHKISSSTAISMKIASVNCTDCKYVVYMLNNTHSNPYGVWLKANKPPTPSVQLLRDMRHNELFQGNDSDKQEPARIAGPSNYSLSEGAFRFTLDLPGVLLMHICDKANMEPDQVTNVAVYNITVAQVLITWEDSCIHTKCIKTYEVEFSSKSNWTYTRINSADTIFNSFVFMPEFSTDDDMAGLYRVRAIDYWDRPGTFSLPVWYPL